MRFASDNAGPVAPEVMAALEAANAGAVASYGGDALTARAVALLREAFEAPEAAVFLVATGTAANALALACLCPPWATVWCHRIAHIEVDECGAPEFFTGGAKLTLLDGPSGKIDPGALAVALEGAAPAGVHNVQPGAVSISNLTEAGAAFAPEEVAALGRIARAAGVPLHMDGARIANALARLGCTPAELTWKAGVDVLSLGGTKNGLMGVEAVVLFDAARAREFALRRKRGGHLLSKHRFLAAQMVAYLEGGLWLRMAAHANALADRLAAGLAAAGGRVLHPVGGNMVFVDLPRAVHDRLRAAGADYYFWPGDPAPEGPPDQMLACRLVCGPSTTAEEVEAFLALL